MEKENYARGYKFYEIKVRTENLIVSAEASKKLIQAYGYVIKSELEGNLLEIILIFDFRIINNTTVSNIPNVKEGVILIMEAEASKMMRNIVSKELNIGDNLLFDIKEYDGNILTEIEVKNESPLINRQNLLKLLHNKTTNIELQKNIKHSLNFIAN